MKKSVRPAASKASGDRVKAEPTTASATGKPGTKSNSSSAPLSKVRPYLRLSDLRTGPSDPLHLLSDLRISPSEPPIRP